MSIERVFERGVVLAAGEYPEHADKLRDYIKRHGFSHDDVRLVKTGESVCVITKRDGVSFKNRGVNEGIESG